MSSLTVNTLRAFFLTNDSGHWSEMILLLQVGLAKLNQEIVTLTWVGGLWVVGCGSCMKVMQDYIIFSNVQMINCICSCELYINQAIRLIFCLNEKNRKSVTSLNCSISRLFHNSWLMMHNAQPTTYAPWPIHLVRDLASTLKLVNASFYWQDFQHISWNIPYVLEALYCGTLFPII